MTAGYMGRLLQADLTSGRLEDRPLDPEWLRQYIGAGGLGARYFADFVRPAGPSRPAAPDPLGPDNPLILMTGPMAGTPLPSASRFNVVARSPLSGIWGESSVGGFFGPHLKFAGYDGIVVTGVSDRPVYLAIDDGRPELRDAADLWGQDTYQVHRRFSPEGWRVLSIGPAGERLVRFASIVHDSGHVAGRGGLGAVMGSKKLKAIIVRGRRPVKLADRAAADALRRQILERGRESITFQTYREVGTISAIEISLMMGDVPAKHWTEGLWEEGLQALGGNNYVATILSGRKTCFGCPVSCKRVVRVDGEPYPVEQGPGPEYETVASFGTMLKIDDLRAVAKLNEICNRQGLDTISCGGTLAFAFEAFERGLIGRGDTGGLDLRWGDPDAAIQLTTQIARREGFGERLAEGSERFASTLGREAQGFLMTVKGVEPPYHDPRAMHGLALQYATSDRGASHLSGLTYYAELGAVYLPDLGVEPPESAQTSEGKAALHVRAQDAGQVLGGALAFCYVGGSIISGEELVAGLKAVTGFDLTIEELLTVGRRIWTLKRLINCAFGMARADDRVPRRFLEPLPDGPAAGSVPDVERMLDEYYRLMGMDETGRPARSEIERLGLDEVAGRLCPGL
ncbi:MAG TPA: aldehyde ferredoxin oxidoreductase family protein [Bacillota bacterium]|jgi:aldehyde:ferredoxin oxidoreductase